MICPACHDGDHAECMRSCVVCTCETCKAAEGLRALNRAARAAARGLADGELSNPIIDRGIAVPWRKR